MASGTLLRLRNHLISLLATVCLLPMVAAETTPDTEEQLPSTLSEVQSKAAQGFVKQELELAADYFVGRGVPKDFTQAAYWYRKAADQGNPGAQVYIGYMYAIGIGVSKDTSEAIRWYRRATSSKSSAAEVSLAGFYMRGEGVKQDTAEAWRLLKSAEEKGSGRADAYLGIANYLGLGVPRDYAAAEAWFKAGVKRHDQVAECLLAALDANEPGRVPNLANEEKLLRLSAAGGYVEGIHSLGLLLVNHPALPQTEGEATNLLTASAQSGYWASSAALGILSRDGRLLAKDQRAAYRWFRIAVLQGGAPAETLLHGELQRAGAGLTDITSVEQEATAWLQLHPNHDLFVLPNQLDAKYFPIQEVYITAGAPAVSKEVGNQTEQPN
jgi:TPR repeat protein